MAEYVQKGESMDYTNAGAETIKYGDIIPIAGRIGVAGCDIPPDKIGSVHVTGVYIMPKVSGVTLVLGQEAFWDETANAITDISTHPAGWVWKSAAATDETVEIKIG